MPQLWLFYEDYYQRLEIDGNDMKKITIGKEVVHDVTILTFPFPAGPMTLEAGGLGYKVFDDNEKLGLLTQQEPVAITRKGRVLKLYETHSFRSVNTYYIDFKNEISFGINDNHSTINRIEDTASTIENGPFSLVKTEDGWKVKMSANCKVYLNGKVISNNQELSIGDVIQWAFMEMQLIDQDVVEISSVANYQTELPIFNVPKSEISKMYPDYRRTPRMIYDVPEDKVSLSFPAQETEDTSRGLWLIIAPPLVMLIVMGICCNTDSSGNLYHDFDFHVFNDACHFDCTIRQR